ncbi:hypothetical protein V6N13_129575 [Hibiscus sabdariffa]
MDSSNIAPPGVIALPLLCFQRESKGIDTCVWYGVAAFTKCCQDTWDWLRIDCGSDTSYKDANGDTWNSDDDYVKTGDNKQVAPSSYSEVEQLNTLRVFSEQNKNCYTLPTPSSTRYLVRAMFWYGNYDGLSKPSIFDLEFDGNKWATVVTNMNNFTYYEMIYATRGDSISICLARTQDQQFPFISRLESIQLPDEMYPQMRRDMAWFNSYRCDYGANDTILGYPADPYNRIWEPSIPPGLRPVTANFTSIDVTSVNDPPDSAIITAVEAQSSADTIDLSFGFGNVSHLDHVEMYFTEPFLQTGETRSFSVIVNNNYVNTTNPEYQNCVSIGANSLSFGTLNVQLVPTNESTLPPIISAIEVYTIETKGLLYVDVAINAAMVDTGASHNFISPEEATRLSVKVTGGKGSIKAVNSAAKPIHGIAQEVKTDVGTWSGRLNFSIVPMDDYKLILGIEFLDQVKAIPMLFAKAMSITEGNQACVVSMIRGTKQESKVLYALQLEEEDTNRGTF